METGSAALEVQVLNATSQLEKAFFQKVITLTLATKASSNVYTPKVVVKQAR